MENNQNKKPKLSFFNIFFLGLFGLAILLFKYYFTRPDLCHASCSSINSELDVIRCLDACAVNSEDFREPLSFKKIILFIIIIAVLACLLHQFINHFIIRRDGNNKILKLIQRIKELKDRLFNKKNYEQFGYKKLDDN